MSPASSRRKVASRQSRERRVADIMAAAKHVFESKGYDEALISDIAERADVVDGTIYRYFDSKRDLLVKVIEHWYLTMLSDYDARLEGIRGTRNRLRFMIWRHLSAIHDDPALCRLMFQQLRTGADYTGSAAFELNRQYTRRTLDIVGEGIAKGELRPDVSQRVVRDMIYGCVEHRTWTYLRGEGALDPNAAADAIVDMVFRGLQLAGPEAEQEDAVARLGRAVERLEGLNATPLHAEPT